MRFPTWLILAILFLSPPTWAQTTLDLAALQQFFQTGVLLEAVQKKYPKLNDGNEEALFGDNHQALIAHIKFIGALEEVTAAVKKGGYGSIDEYLSMAKRVMVALIAVQLAQVPDSSAENMRKMVESQKKELEANGISPATIAQMMTGVNEQLAQLDKLRAVAKTARADDIAVVKANLDYVTKMTDSQATP